MSDKDTTAPVRKPSRKPKTSTELVPATGQTPAAPRALVTTEAVLTFERLAKDPAVDVGKLERLIALQKDIIATQAKADFNAAYARMQPQLPKVTKRGIIRNRAGMVQSRYTRLEDLQEATKPICAAHGFSIRHRTEWPREGIIHIVGILSHEGGHSEESHFEAPMDRSDYRSDVQSMGSTITYGRRYTTMDLLNITQEGVDDDGQGATKTESPAPRSEHPNSDKLITEPQIKRLHAIANKSGRKAEEIRAWLAVAFNYASSADIKRKDYDQICAAIEKPGPLPEVRRVIEPEVVGNGKDGRDE